MQITKFLFTSLLTASLSSASNSTDSVSEYWFNGAEINRYELIQARYGAQHSGHVEFIFVTEPFLPDQQVKHEYGSGNSINILKLNALRTFNTGIYSYRTMTSTFRPIDLATYPHALKTTTSVQDWCGQVFQQINRTETGWQVQLRSYFQNEADQDFKLTEAWLEEELWLLVRLNPEELPSGEIEVVPSAVYSRFTHKPIRPTHAIGTLDTGTKHSSYTLTYPSLQRSLTIYFDSAFPHIIREWKETAPQGTTRAVLAQRIMNSYYWSENRPADRIKRRHIGLEPVAD